MSPEEAKDTVRNDWPDLYVQAGENSSEFTQRMRREVVKSRNAAAEYKRILMRDANEEAESVRKERDVVIGLGWLMIATGRVLASWHEPDPGRQAALAAAAPIALAGASRMFGLDLAKLFQSQPGGSNDQTQAPAS